MAVSMFCATSLSPCGTTSDFAALPSASVCGNRRLENTATTADMNVVNR